MEIRRLAVGATKLIIGPVFLFLPAGTLRW
jgi:hypothetical protein